MVSLDSAFEVKPIWCDEEDELGMYSNSSDQRSVVLVVEVVFRLAIHSLGEEAEDRLTRIFLVKMFSGGLEGSSIYRRLGWRRMKLS